MKRTLHAVTTVVVVLIFFWVIKFYWQNLRGIGPALQKPPADIVDLIGNGQTPPDPGKEEPKPAQNDTGFPLAVPNGFRISVFAKNLPNARVLRFDAAGNLWVSQTRSGLVSKLTLGQGKVMAQDVVFRGLNNPHGLAFDPQDANMLYIAEEHRISRVNLSADKALKKVADLPSGGGHYTRTIGFGPDGRLYVSIGSSCNVCYEKDERRAKIFTMNKDGSDMKEYARGLRNAVFFTWHPVTGKMWATDMGRDLLGDDIPPDEINVVEEGKNYGWPICYGQNIHDTSFDKNTYIRNPCLEPFESPAKVDLQAHSAPLGLAFISDHELVAAYHGSWNRSVPTGYKLVRVTLDASGNVQGVEDFITGWLTPSGALGRPVDVLMGKDGVLYVSDDKAGVIYAIFPQR